LKSGGANLRGKHFSYAPPLGPRVRTLLDRRKEMIAWYIAVVINSPASFEAILAQYQSSDFAPNRHQKILAGNLHAVPGVIHERHGIATGARNFRSECTHVHLRQVRCRGYVESGLVRKSAMALASLAGFGNGDTVR